jgi:hypothetical protein
VSWIEWGFSTKCCLVIEVSGGRESAPQISTDSISNALMTYHGQFIYGTVLITAPYVRVSREDMINRRKVKAEVPEKGCSWKVALEFSNDS